MNQLAEWEMLVLSACLREARGFPIVASILSAKNFSVPQHAEIWEAMCKLWPNNPINVFSIEELVDCKLYSLDIIVKFYCSIENLQFYAMKLVEEDIRKKLIALMDVVFEKHFKHSPNVSFARGYLEEVKACLGIPLNDVFEVLEGTIQYFGTIELMKPALADLEDFNSNLDKKCIHIKKQAHLDVLFNHLNSLSNIPNTNRLVLNKLVQIAKLSLSGKDLPTEIETSILSFKA